jgi:hypothetical protein
MMTNEIISVRIPNNKENIFTLNNGDNKKNRQVFAREYVVHCFVYVFFVSDARQWHRDIVNRIRVRTGCVCVCVCARDRERENGNG